MAIGRKVISLKENAGLAGGLAGLGGAFRCVSNLYDPVRQLVRVEGTWREVPGQLLAAQFDRGDETIARTPVPDRRNHRRYGAGPSVGRYLVIDAAVGDDFRVPLGDGCENQHAGTLLGEVDAVRQELT